MVFITPRDAKYGFSLAGARQFVIEKTETEDILRRLSEDKDLGVVVIDERLIEGIDEEKLRSLEERFRGIMQILPSPDRFDEKKDYIMRLIKRTLGYYMRIR